MRSHETYCRQSWRKKTMKPRRQQHRKAKACALSAGATSSRLSWNLQVKDCHWAASGRMTSAANLPPAKLQIEVGERASLASCGKSRHTVTFPLTLNRTTVLRRGFADAGCHRPSQEFEPQLQENSQIKCSQIGCNLAT